MLPDKYRIRWIETDSTTGKRQPHYIDVTTGKDSIPYITGFVLGKTTLNEEWVIFLVTDKEQARVVLTSEEVLNELR